MQVNKGAGFMVYSWIKEADLAKPCRNSLSREAVFTWQISGRRNHGEHFLHTLSRLALSPLRNDLSKLLASLQVEDFAILPECACQQHTFTQDSIIMALQLHTILSDTTTICLAASVFLNL